jgi:hypothetical protein
VKCFIRTQEIPLALEVFKNLLVRVLGVSEITMNPIMDMVETQIQDGTTIMGIEAAEEGEVAIEILTEVGAVKAEAVVVVLIAGDREADQVLEDPDPQVEDLAGLNSLQTLRNSMVPLKLTLVLLEVLLVSLRFLFGRKAKRCSQVGWMGL